MISARYPPRLSVPSPCLLAVSFRRSVFRVSPFFVSGGGAWGGAGAGLVGKSGRWSSGGRRLLGRSVRVCSLVSRGRSVCSIVSVSGAVSDIWQVVSGRPWLLAWAIVLVPSRAFLSAIVRSLPACSSRCCRPVSRPVCLVGGAVRRRVGCLLARFVAAVGRTMSCLSRPVLLLVCSLRGAGKRGYRASRLACLVEGTASMCSVPLPVPVAVRLLALCV